MVTDDELVERARREDPEAFGLLVDRHRDAVVNYLTRLGGCRERAEELAQETFLRFYQRLSRYRRQGACSAYLFSIATNLLRSEERRRRRWRLLRPLLPGNGHAAGRTPGSEALASEEQRLVARALAALDLTYRAPLVLREIEGLSYRDVAQALGLTEGTVKSRLYRAKQQLRDQLAPYWNGGRPR